MIKINKSSLEQLNKLAASDKRRRKIKNFHTSDDDSIQRMLNGLQEDSYCRPHRHITPVKREVFLILKGSIAVVEFDDNGGIIDSSILNSSDGNYAVEITPTSWHTIVCFEDNSVLYEIKDGPYDAETDKEFASWSPKENSEEGQVYLSSLRKKIIE
jgi:cupin fold WbuC family metalloprotein